MKKNEKTFKMQIFEEKIETKTKGCIWNGNLGISVCQLIKNQKKTKIKVLLIYLPEGFSSLLSS